MSIKNLDIIVQWSTHLLHQILYFCFSRCGSRCTRGRRCKRRFGTCKTNSKRFGKKRDDQEIDILNVNNKTNKQQTIIITTTNNKQKYNKLFI